MQLNLRPLIVASDGNHPNTETTMNMTQMPARRHVRFNLVSFAILSLAGMAGSTAALAADAAGMTPRTLTVQYADLNLANPQGVERLYDRIVGAAHEVCSDPDSKSLGVWFQTRSCTKQAIERAVATIHSSALTALHAARTGRPPVQVVKR